MLRLSVSYRLTVPSSFAIASVLLCPVAGSHTDVIQEQRDVSFLTIPTCKTFPCTSMKTEQCGIGCVLDQIRHFNHFYYQITFITCSITTHQLTKATLDTFFSYLISVLHALTARFISVSQVSITQLGFKHLKQNLNRTTQVAFSTLKETYSIQGT